MPKEDSSQQNDFSSKSVSLEIEKLKNKVKQAEERAKQAETRRVNDLIRLQSSKPYRLTKLTTEAIRHPRRLVKYPYRLMRTLFSKPLFASLYALESYNVLTIKHRKKVPDYELANPGVVGSKQLKIAAILDDFSYASFKHDADILELKPLSWKIDMDAFKPDMLFVESAWRGKDDNWRHLVANMSKDLDLIIRYCRENGIPTVFWCKEDPVHFKQFLGTAKYFDFIYTSDAGSVADYKKILKHDRVFTLQFASQPVLMNPIEKYDRKDAVCFAGSYYVKYPHRSRDMNEIFDALQENKIDFDIYDRNFNKGIVMFEFPDKYKKHIKGSLSFDEIDIAYKGYYYALTMNTIKDSETMFARRAFELLASNTITVSNYCLGIIKTLGNLIISSDDGEEIVRKLKKLHSSAEMPRIYRLHGLREVMEKHTYEARVKQMCADVFENYDYSEMGPSIAVITKVDSKKQLDEFVAMFKTQTYSNYKLYAVTDNNLNSVSGVKTVLSKDIKNGLGKIIKQDWVAPVELSNFYGDDYLKDLALANKYSDAAVIGKSAYYQLTANKLELKKDKTQYKHEAKTHPYASILKTELVSGIDTVEGAATQVNKSLAAKRLSIDEFNFCVTGGKKLKNNHQRVVEADIGLIGI